MGGLQGGRATSTDIKEDGGDTGASVSRPDLPWEGQLCDRRSVLSGFTSSPEPDSDTSTFSFRSLIRTAVGPAMV